MMGAVSCQKDDEMVTPLETRDTVTPPVVDTDYVEGVFNPSHHVATCTELGGYYEYTWSDNQPLQLLEVNDPVLGSHMAYTYKSSGRVASAMGRYDGHEQMYAFTYNDGILEHITHREDNLIQYVASVSYTDNHVSHIVYEDVTADMMVKLANELSDYDFGTANVTMDDPHFTVSYKWDEDNVVKTVVEGIVTGDITLSQMFSLFGSSILGGLSIPDNIIEVLPLLIQLMGDETYTYDVTFARTSEYTYDAFPNPYRGFYGDGLLLHTEFMSANNILTEVTRGAAELGIDYTIHLPENPPSWAPESLQNEMLWSLIRVLISDRPFHFARTLDLSDTEDNTYEYNGYGFPVRCTCQDGSRITYSYQD